jgi:SAM-dependent methyltransferase
MSTSAVSPKRLRIPRPSLSWADLRQSPLHDFPVRDEVLFQFMDWSPDHDVLEVGPGSGFTAFWFSRLVHHLTLLDAADQTIVDLRSQLGTFPNLDFIAADAAQPGLDGLLQRRFDAAFGLDVFDLIPDPVNTLRNLAQCLRPGGQLLLSFPNVAPPRAKGVTCFRRAEDLEGILRSVGFSRWEIFNIRLRPYAASVYALLHEYPLKLFRRIRRGQPKDFRPQVYQATWAFRHRGRMSRFKPLLHMYWKIIGWTLYRRGEVFVRDLERDSILDGQLVLRAWR